MINPEILTTVVESMDVRNMTSKNVRRGTGGWEYKIVEFGVNSLLHEELLNQMGGEFWELVHVTDADIPTYFFKRPWQQPDESED